MCIFHRQNIAYSWMQLFISSIYMTPDSKNKMFRVGPQAALIWIKLFIKRNSELCREICINKRISVNWVNNSAEWSSQDSKCLPTAELWLNSPFLELNLRLDWLGYPLTNLP